MLEIMHATETVQQNAVLDRFLERAAEIIAAQPKPGRALTEAKGMLSRKVHEVTRAAQDHLARQSR
jgi:hypothetical protein